MSLPPPDGGLTPSVPPARIDLEEWEYVTCMKTVALRSQETVSGLKGYVAAGTCLMQGEEVTCRGRVRTRKPYPSCPVAAETLSKRVPLVPDSDPGRDRGGAGAGPAAHQEQVQSAVREGAEGPGDGTVPLQRIPGVGHRPEGTPPSSSPKRPGG